MKAAWLVMGVGLVACAGEPVVSDDTDTDMDTEPTGCVEVEDTFSRTLLGEGVIEGRTQGIALRSSCTQPVEITEVELVDLVAGFSIDRDLVLPETLPPGGRVLLSLGFETDEAGTYTDTLRAWVSNGEVIDVPLTVEVIATDWQVDLPTEQLVRTCPTRLEVGITPTNQYGTVLDAKVSLDGQELWRLQERPTAVTEGERLTLEGLVTLNEPTASVRLELEEPLRGELTWDFELSTDPSAERSDVFPAWTDGRPLDVLITLDRRMAGYDEGAVREGLGALLDRLAGLDADYRAVGLLRDDGCPMGGGPVAPDTEGGVDRLAAQLDLRFSRVGETGVEERPLEQVEVALGAVNTADGGCNDWIRDDAALLVVHVLGEDDRSSTTVAEHLTRLRADLPGDDHLAIAAIAPPPPDGCGGGGGAARLQQAARDTGGSFLSVCEADLTSALPGLATVPGDEGVLRLSEAPFPPSLEVLVDGRPEPDATLDGRTLTLPRSVDRFRDEVEVLYVAAEACPAG